MVHVMSEVKRYWVPCGVLADQSGWHQDDNEVVLAGEHDAALDAQRLRADTAEAELKELEEAVVWALPGTRFMDPPYGGSPTLGEQVGRMAEALAAAEQRIAELAEALKNLQNAAYNIGGEHVTGYQWLIDAADDAGAAVNPNPEAESHE